MDIIDAKTVERMRELLPHMTVDEVVNLVCDLVAATKPTPIVPLTPPRNVRKDRVWHRQDDMGWVFGPQIRAKDIPDWQQFLDMVQDEVEANGYAVPRDLITIACRKLGPLWGGVGHGPGDVTLTGRGNRMTAILQRLGYKYAHSDDESMIYRERVKVVMEP
jgi:hypothetical protein